MLKRILVALDPDSDTPIATEYAANIARRYGAEVTGLAVVDLGSIEASSRGGGIGSMYYAEKLRDKLTSEARATAQALIEDFEKAMKGTGVAHVETVQEGVPFQRIIEDMNYYDLLVIGKNPHFFYSHPKQETHTLARVVKNTVGPTLVVGTESRPVERVLITFDGSRASARTIREFAHLQPWGTDVRIQIIHIYKDGEAESELLLRMAQAYLKAYGFPVQVQSMKSKDPEHQIVEYAAQCNPDLVLVGAHSRSKIKEIAFGSVTNALLEHFPAPLFIDS
ncbi:universal stress protein [Rhodocaloribacter sp.]